MADPTIANVRSYLNELDAKLVPDPTITLQLAIAKTMVDGKKSASCPTLTYEQAELAVAGYLTYIAYLTKIERGRGDLPPPAAAHLKQLEGVMNTMLGFAQRGQVTSVKLLVLTESIEDVIDELAVNEG